MPSVAPPPPAHTGPPTLAKASYRDANGSRAIDKGDALVIVFDAPVRLSGFDPSRDLALAPGDDLGAGATAAPDPSRRDTVIVTLGAQPRLSVFGTYSPGAPPGPGKSPATVALASGRKRDAVVDVASGAPAADAPPAAVYAEDGSRFVYQGRVYAETSTSAARAYFGNLHSHTGFSDGELDPAQAWDYARNKAKLDFMCVTDHLEQISDAHWDLTQKMADAANAPGTFVTLVGFEWAHGWIPPLGWYNHLNVIGTTHRISVPRTVALSGFYQDSVDLCLPDGAVGKFNHVFIRKPHLQFNQWDDFAYDPRADLLMRLIRVEGNGSDQTKELGLIPALDKGWHVSATSSQDNHDADWGTANDRRTGVWLPSLDRASLMTALREGRTFSTDDKNATIRLLADGAIWMGSTIARPGPVRLTVDVQDPDPGDGFAKVEIVGRHGAVVASKDLKGAGSGTFDLVVDPAEDSFFWAHAIQTDGDELFSAPIFVDR
jgi:hypothetical protein